MNREAAERDQSVERVLPLDGVRVVELAQLVSGPLCGTLLADLGAEVVKVEPLSGDMARRFAPFRADGESAFFLAANRMKRSIRLDLRSEEGRAELERLLSSADVLIHNMRVDAARRLAVDADAVTTRHPGLVVCEITAFGTEADADRVGVDLIFQAEAGLMSVTGEPDGRALRAGPHVPDVFAASTATAGVLAALRERDRTGRAPVVSISMLDATLALQTCWLAAHSGGGAMGRLGNASPFSAPTGSFPASDRELVVSIVHDAHWARLCAILGRPELIDDPRFGTNDLRCSHRDELFALLGSAFCGRTAEEWVDELCAAGLPAALVRTYDEVLDRWGDRFSAAGGIALTPAPWRLRCAPGKREQPIDHRSIDR
jgi:crotonobetainyl-CoA:carnitine CoA-transferase CaiB-like acyl-CoA transferase